MADGLPELDRWIERLREMGSLAERSAPAVARAVEADILEHVSRGVGPDGAPWPPTADGHLPLQGVAKDLRVRAVGTTVVATLEGVHARHHLGAVRGGKKRPILPTRRMPDSMTRAVRRVVEDEFRRELGGLR